MNFGDVRSFFHTVSPSEMGWESLCEILEDMVPEEREQGLMYAQQMLSDWPDEYRVLNDLWLDDVGVDTRSMYGPHPAWRLARTINLAAYDVDVVRQMLASSWVSHLTVFNCADYFIFLRDLALLEALTTSMRVQSLEALSLYGCFVNTAGVEVLSRAWWLGQVKFLNLSANHLGDEALDLLCGAEALSSLEVLILTVNAFTQKGAQRLATTPLGALRYLDMGQNNLGESSAVTLATAGFTSLESLLLPRNHIGAGGMMALAAQEDLSNLKALDVCHNGLGDLGVKALAQSPHLRRLEHLDLEGNGMTDEGALALANSPYLGKLKTLYLAGNALGQRGRDALKGSPLGEAVHFDVALEQLPPPMLRRLI